MKRALPFFLFLLLTSSLAAQTSNRIVIPAKKLHEMGIVDVLAKDGQGESAVQQWIAKDQRRHNGTRAVFGLRQICNPITRRELDAVIESWVDAAMRLSERDLRMMSWLVRAQQERAARGEHTEAAEAAPAVAVNA